MLSRKKDRWASVIVEKRQIIGAITEKRQITCSIMGKDRQHVLSWKNTFVVLFFYKIVRRFYVAHVSHYTKHGRVSAQIRIYSFEVASTIFLYFFIDHQLDPLIKKSIFALDLHSISESQVPKKYFALFSLILPNMNKPGH